MAKGHNKTKNNNWKIAIYFFVLIVIVLILLYTSGFTSDGTSFLHPSCIAGSGYVCANQSATTVGATPGNVLVGITFGQNSGVYWRRRSI